MKKRRLDLELALPSDAAACDACVTRLLDTVRASRGVVDAHLDTSDAKHPKLCLHYEPAAVRLAEVEALVVRAGAELKARFEHLSVPAAGLRHERQARLAEDVFAKQPGVFHAAVSFGTRRLYVEFDPAKTTRAALLAVAAEAGIAAYEESSSPALAAREHDQHEHEHGGPFGERSELVFSLACGALTAAGWVLGKVGVTSTALFIAAYGLGSWFTLKEILVALRARRFEIDFLMLLAAAWTAFGNRAATVARLVRLAGRMSFSMRIAWRL